MGGDPCPWKASGRSAGSWPRGVASASASAPSSRLVIRYQVRSGPPGAASGGWKAASGPPFARAVPPRGGGGPRARIRVSSPARPPARVVRVDRQHRDPAAADPPLDREQVRARFSERDRRGPRARPQTRDEDRAVRRRPDRHRRAVRSAVHLEGLRGRARLRPALVPADAGQHRGRIRRRERRRSSSIKLLLSPVGSAGR